MQKRTVFIYKKIVLMKYERIKFLDKFILKQIIHANRFLK